MKSPPPVIPPKNRASPAELREKRRRESRIAEYTSHRNAVGEAMLRATLRALATTEAAGMVNSILEDKFGLESAGIVVGEVQSYAVSILRMEIMQALAGESRLDAATRRRMARRLAARLMPLRDNQPASAPSAGKAAYDIEGALERIIQRDLQRNYGGKKS